VSGLDTAIEEPTIIENTKGSRETPSNSAVDAAIGSINNAPALDEMILEATELSRKNVIK
tara:strand:+ start:309 stop:488 length:180 start_codon:yes stop_codon:yes gene_type:complete